MKKFEDNIGVLANAGFRVIETGTTETEVPVNITWIASPRLLLGLFPTYMSPFAESKTTEVGHPCAEMTVTTWLVLPSITGTVFVS